MLHAGQLDRRVTIQQATFAQNGMGEPIATWADVATVWGSFTPLAGREPFVSDQLAAFQQARFTLRYRSDVTLTPKMRLVMDSRTYQILAVAEPVRRETIEVTAEARAE